MLSIIIPTYNEAGNIKNLVQRIHSVMPKDVEILIVDDNSPDGTGRIADELAKKYPVRVIHRAGKRGFASAMMDGIKHARGDLLCTMDADLSHPPELLPKMIKPITEGEAEITVASRRVPGGKVIGWPLLRHIISWGATTLAMPLTKVKDRTSGFAVFKKDVIKGVKLDLIGYKIVLEVLVRGKYNRAIEVPCVFNNRLKGKSKTNLKMSIWYLRHLRKLYAHKFW